jgi:hypothetical protein
MPALALAALVGLALAACAPAHPGPTPSSSPAQTPLFSSDEEALKAATDAYAAYLKVSDEISHDGGANPERIKPYVTTAAYKNLQPDFQALSKSGRHTQGGTTLRDPRLSQHTGTMVELFLCSDVSAVRIVDANGADVTPAARQDVLPLDVEFKVRDDNLLIAKSSVWSGEDFC